MPPTNKVFVKKKEKNDVVGTPEILYKALNEEFQFDFDPCPFNPKFNGLQINWKKCNFVNPPYSRIKPWVKKAVEEMENGNKSVLLIPGRTHLKYWFELIFPFCSEIRFLQNFKFQGYKKVCPFPCCIIVFDPEKKSKFITKGEDKDVKQVCFV